MPPDYHLPNEPSSWTLFPAHIRSQLLQRCLVIRGLERIVIAAGMLLRPIASLFLLAMLQHFRGLLTYTLG